MQQWRLIIKESLVSWTWTTSASTWPLLFSALATLSRHSRFSLSFFFAFFLGRWISCLEKSVREVNWILWFRSWIYSISCSSFLCLSGQNDHTVICFLFFFGLLIFFIFLFLENILLFVRAILGARIFFFVFITFLF